MSEKKEGTLQKNDRMGTIVAIIIFIATLITGALSIGSSLTLTEIEFNWSLFFVFYTPTITSAISLLVFKLTGHQLKQNDAANIIKEEGIRSIHDSKIDKLEKKLNKSETDLIEARRQLAEEKGNNRLYDDVLGIKDWLRNNFHTTFGRSSIPTITPKPAPIPSASDIFSLKTTESDKDNDDIDSDEDISED